MVVTFLVIQTSGSLIPVLILMWESDIFCRKFVKYLANLQLSSPSITSVVSRERTRGTRVSFRMLLSRDFSQLPQMENLDN